MSLIRAEYGISQHTGEQTLRFRLGREVDAFGTFSSPYWASCGCVGWVVVEFPAHPAHGEAASHPKGGPPYVTRVCRGRVGLLIFTLPYKCTGSRRARHATRHRIWMAVGLQPPPTPDPSTSVSPLTGGPRPVTLLCRAWVGLLIYFVSPCKCEEVVQVDELRIIMTPNSTRGTLSGERTSKIPWITDYSMSLKS